MWPVLFINIDAGGENMDSIFERHKVLPLDVDESGLPTGPPSASDPWNMVALTAPVNGNMWDWLVQVLTWPDWESRLGIRTVVFDGFSTLGKYILTLSAQTQQFTSAKAREAGGGTPSIGEKEKFYQPSPGDYGLAQNSLSNVRAMMTAREWNVIAAAHQTLRVQEVDGQSTTLAGPSLPGTASMQDFGAEWSQFLRFYLGKPKVVNGDTHSMIRVQLAHQGYWPARVRKGPDLLDKPSWLLQYDHPEMWRYIAHETGVVFRHGEPLECYTDMPEGSERGDAVKRDPDGTINNLKDIGLA